MERQIALGKNLAINLNHRSLILSVVSTIHRTVLYMIKERLTHEITACSNIKSDESLLSLGEIVDKMTSWHEVNQNPDASVSSLALEVMNLIR